MATLLSSEAHELMGAVGSIWALATIILAAVLVLYAMAMKRGAILR